MSVAIRVNEIGVRFRVRRHTQYGLQPRILGQRRQEYWGLRGVTFDAYAGEVIGVIGANGSGKTTLLRVLAGIYRPDEGEVGVAGRVSPLLSFSAGFKRELSGRENIDLAGALLGLTRSESRRVAAEAEDLGLEGFLDAEVRTYSAGMKTRLGFALATASEPSILLLDEVITFGDRSFRERAEGIIRDYAASGGSVLVASHEMDRLLEMSDRLLQLEDGALVSIGRADQVAAAYMGTKTGR